MTIRLCIYTTDVAVHAPELTQGAVHYHAEPSGLGLAIHHEHG